ncbi:hypothetical protein GY45DRAFT_1079005 [Cubamyces sp. BRFM 1775]|nr:hypothetical protein GY45DRAFT_1079005 [Cubamyces sp. BRFM 1775]
MISGSNQSPAKLVESTFCTDPHAGAEISNLQDVCIEQDRARCRHRLQMAGVVSSGPGLRPWTIGSHLQRTGADRVGRRITVPLSSTIAEAQSSRQLPSRALVSFEFPEQPTVALRHISLPQRGGGRASHDSLCPHCTPRQALSANLILCISPTSQQTRPGPRQS